MLHTSNIVNLANHAKIKDRVTKRIVHGYKFQKIEEIGCRIFLSSLNSLSKNHVQV